MEFKDRITRSLHSESAAQISKEVGEGGDGSGLDAAVSEEVISYTDNPLYSGNATHTFDIEGAGPSSNSADAGDSRRLSSLAAFASVARKRNSLDDATSKSKLKINKKNQDFAE